MDTVAVVVPEDPELWLNVIQLPVTEEVHEADDMTFIDDDVTFGCVMSQVLQDVVGAPTIGVTVASFAGWLIVTVFVPPEFLI